MNESIKELIAIGASVGAHCQPCLEYHIQAAIELGVSPGDIQQAIAIGHQVEKGAMVAMKKFSEEAVKDFSAHHTGLDNPAVQSAVVESNSLTILKIYDPAMCCSSGVCGPSVDPILVQFAGTLNYIASQPGIRVERYNLGQQPQAFVDNAAVKTMLGNGGEKRLPFIFINDTLAFQSRYPTKDELVRMLGMKEQGAVSLNSVSLPVGTCCSDKGCC
jgi:AhpD family alkylhydroperoxidase